VLIPKPDGRQRPLGVTTLEDKLVQRALVLALNCIYEVDFLGFSYGFRPGRSPHNALDALYVGIKKRRVNWVLDADIRGYFDAISHEWLVKFIEHRIADRRVVHLIQKWLNAGVLEDGEWRPSEIGTPQGGGISPLLANVYLHYVFDLWVRAWRRRAAGDVIVVRYADDIIVGFEYEWEARRFWNELRDRFAKFGLALHPDKTRLIEFGRHAAANRKRNGRPSCPGGEGPSRWRWHDPVPEVGQWLASVIRGHLNYYAVPLNFAAIEAFHHQVICLWKRVLSRRSQKAHVTWERMRRIARLRLPRVRIVHPWPEQRLAF
jgi:hypothetical protein